MKRSRDNDPAGYESHAAEFITRRNTKMGVVKARLWARGFRRGARVLELGAGFGVPVTQTLLKEGLTVSAIEGSITLADELKRRFPGVEVAWEPIEDSNLFGRQFEGVIAVGLVFLLTPAAQRELFCKVALALEPRGRFLFTAPVQTGEWIDDLTGHRSISLGEAGYRSALDEAGFEIISQYTDEGDNNYYDCRLR
jgi:hypothetical protein